jgi:hypothetical protein
MKRGLLLLILNLTSILHSKAADTDGRISEAHVHEGEGIHQLLDASLKTREYPCLKYFDLYRAQF